MDHAERVGNRVSVALDIYRGCLYYALAIEGLHHADKGRRVAARHGGLTGFDPYAELPALLHVETVRHAILGEGSGHHLAGNAH